MMSFTRVTSIQVICGQKVPIADKDVMDVSSNCYVPVEGLCFQGHKPDEHFLEGSTLSKQVKTVGTVLL